MGGIVAPPESTFYARPETIDDIVDQTMGRVLDLFDLEAGTFPRWGETIALTTPARRKSAADAYT